VRRRVLCNYRVTRGLGAVGIGHGRAGTTTT
jgi:hypothetical protein